MPDQTRTYQCINANCGHAMPRVVTYCPYCGTPQRAGAVRPVTVTTVAAVAPAVAAAVPEPVTAIPQPQPPQFVSPVPPVPPVRVPPAPALPPQRAPLHWGWWLIGVGLLWLAWMIARPASHKLDTRVDTAIAMAQACKGKQAQSELIALRAARATPAQLQRLQAALNAASTSCERTRLRDKAWLDASNAIDTALAASAPERARTRLATFIRRWDEDADTAAARARIDAARRDQAAPASAPTRAANQESASNLITEAERDIGRGNYKGAIDKMETCVGMVDAGNRDCLALKAKAEKLYQGL